MARTTKDWSQAEFDRLAELVIDTVADGGSFQQACEIFSKESNGLRSIGASKFKYITKLSELYKDEYEWAKEEGAKKRAERLAAEQSEKANDEPKQPKKRGRKPNADKVVQMSETVSNESTTKMTKRELVRFLRDIELVGDDEEDMRGELERVRSELNDAIRERDELKHQLLLLQKKYDDLEEGYNAFLVAFNRARMDATKVVEPSADKYQYVVNKDGTVTRVEKD